MKLTAEDYLGGSRYRIETARRLLDQHRYSAASYLAGVAVECLLRAYIFRKEPSFDARHDLGKMLTRSELRDLVAPHERENVGRWLGDIWTRWKNNYRFVTDLRLETELRARLAPNRRVEQDFLIKNSRQVVESAIQLQTLGELRWEKRS